MEFVNSAGSVLSLVALLVAAIAVAYSALTRTTITTLKESNAAYAERITNLEKDRVTDQAAIATLKAERDTLARVVTGEVHLVTIEGQLQQHHDDAQAWWTGATEILTAIQQSLEKS